MKPTKPQRKVPVARKAEPEPQRAHSDSAGLERLILFSDAVFAIAITLLVLDIRLPTAEESLTNAELLDQLLALWPKYLGYVVSFIVIGGFWINHHARFRKIVRYDGTLLLLNLLLLMMIAFTPFPTQILSEYGNRTATIFYALTMVITGVMSALMWWYATHNNRLVDATLSLIERRRGFRSALIFPIVFLLSVGIAFINDDAAKYSWLLTFLILRFLIDRSGSMKREAAVL